MTVQTKGRGDVARDGDPPSLRPIYYIGLAATAIGIAIIILLNLATPLEYMHGRPTALGQIEAVNLGKRLRGIFNLAFLLLLSCLPLLYSIRRILSPLYEYFDLLKAGRESKELLDRVKRRLINLPFIMVPVNLGLWIVLPVALFFAAYATGQLDSRTAVILAVRAIMVGFISAGVMSLWIESYARRMLIPFFFPQGRLADLDNVARYSISRRIRLHYRLGSLAPLAILVVTLATLQWQLDSVSISAKEYGSGILVFCLVLFSVFFITLSVLNKLITRSIVGPLHSILDALLKIREGNLQTRVKVVSNDETGILGDATNKMIQGLRERELLKDAFGKYVTPEIRDEILSGRIPLDGELKNVTVLFADLRDFTPLVASTRPQQVVKLINGYFEEMSKAIHGNGGLVLQFIGDEIEAVFGAPLVIENHPAAAARAALEMYERLDRYNSKLGEQGWAPLRHGIGLHTGQVLAGNIGSSERLSYALVGDTVNLASRLQGVSKELGRNIILSAATRKELGDEFICEALETVKIKGWAGPVEVFALSGI
ncbi:MAG: HAMP domain-containing protein [Deltaproteobacteria bacterium]|nr:HAMP domain-containing protein [Deltaproteobacteria bacterium]